MARGATGGVTSRDKPGRAVVLLTHVSDTTYTVLDIVLIRADDINTIPLNDPAATVVTCADTSKRRHRDRAR
jgi:sortase (surface protein transpeptidase)